MLLGEYGKQLGLVYFHINRYDEAHQHLDRARVEVARKATIAMSVAMSRRDQLIDGDVIGVLVSQMRTEVSPIVDNGQKVTTVVHVYVSLTS